MKHDRFETFLSRILIRFVDHSKVISTLFHHITEKTKMCMFPTLQLLSHRKFSRWSLSKLCCRKQCMRRSSEWTCWFRKNICYTCPYSIGVCNRSTVFLTVGHNNCRPLNYMTNIARPYFSSTCADGCMQHSPATAKQKERYKEKLRHVCRRLKFLQWRRLCSR